jgi:hypothetical protein
LRGLLVDEGLLEGMRVLLGAKALQGDDLAVADGGHGSLAGSCCPAVNKHRAGTTLSQAATEFGAIQFELIAKNEEEGAFWLSLDAVQLPVYVKAQRCHSDVPSLRTR